MQLGYSEYFETILTKQVKWNVWGIFLFHMCFRKVPENILNLYLIRYFLNIPMKLLKYLGIFECIREQVSEISQAQKYVY